MVAQVSASNRRKGAGSDLIGAICDAGATQNLLTLLKLAEHEISDLVENRRRAVLHHANLFCYDVLLSQTSCSFPGGGSIARPPAEKRRRQVGALRPLTERRP
jgi:hypothetical protein